MAITRTYTADDLFELDLDTPFELIDGELFTLPGSGHQSSTTSIRIVIEMGIYLKSNPIGLISGEGGGALPQS